MEFPWQPVNFTYIGTVANILYGQSEDNQLKLDVVNKYIPDADSVLNTLYVICGVIQMMRYVWTIICDFILMQIRSYRILYQSILPLPLTLQQSLWELLPLGHPTVPTF